MPACIIGSIKINYLNYNVGVNVLKKSLVIFI